MTVDLSLVPNPRHTRGWLIAAAPAAVPCPYCHAPAGVRCHTPNHHQALTWHAARKAAVADWDDNTKLAKAAQRLMPELVQDAATRKAAA